MKVLGIESSCDETGVALVEIDGDVPADVLAKVQALPQVKQAKALVF